MKKMGANRFCLQASGSFATFQDAYADMFGKPRELWRDGLRKMTTCLVFNPAVAV